MEWFAYLRFYVGVIFLILGLVVFLVEVIGVFKLDYVMNRMHAAGMGDTLGIGFSILGLMILNGWNMITVKMIMVLVFLWFSSPVSSHLIGKLEISTHEGPNQYEEEER
ncbi:MAG: monovalent cation/H(+) antiporter subunit G [Lachnospiraceae bacterium]|nr:monovalent cation/H(+) antiporter subunit G [Lachnospiraceae bacterium]